MSHSSLQPAIQQVWPAPLDLSPEQMALAALRHEIDVLDDQLLTLFERRLAIAARVGRAKDAPCGPHLKLRPDRERAVHDRVLAQAAPDNREAVESLWREIVGWGLARQGRMQVQVWSPIEPTRAFDGARLRFGAAADMKAVRDPQPSASSTASAARPRRRWRSAASIRRPCPAAAAFWSPPAATPATAPASAAAASTPTTAGPCP